MSGGNPEESERRRFFYSDLEVLVRRGFLQAHVPFDGVPLVFRTISEQDRRLLVARSVRSPNIVWMQWVVAHSLFMADGFVFATNSNTPYHIKKHFLDHIPTAFLRVLFSIVMGLQRRVERALPKLEAFCYEDFTRTLWRTKAFSREFRNPVVDSWIAFQEGEDARIQDGSEWIRTQTIVGSMSAKSAKSVKRSLDQERQKEEARRTRVIEDTVNEIVNGKKKETTVMVNVNGRQMPMPIVRGAQTVAELEEEMRKAMAGELDGHDVQVQQYEDAVRKAVKDRAAKAQARQERESQMGDLMRQVGIGGSTKLVGYEVGQLPAQGSAGVKTQATSSSSHRLFDRYLRKEVGVGVLGATGPEPLRKGSLNDQLEGRKVQMSSDLIPSDKVRGPNE